MWARRGCRTRCEHCLDEVIHVRQHNAVAIRLAVIFPLHLLDLDDLQNGLEACVVEELPIQLSAATPVCTKVPTYSSEPLFIACSMVFGNSGKMKRKRIVQT